MNSPIEAAALALFAKPVTSESERAEAQAFAARRAKIVANGDALFELGFPCTGCGKFAFDKPTLCFWCRT